MNRFVHLTTSTLFFLAASTAFTWPTAAQAAPPTTGTIQTHGSWVAPEDYNPCTGHTVAVTITGHMVEHFTYFTASDFRLAISETGQSTFTDGGITYTGKFQLHVDFIDTTANAIQNVSLSLRLQGTDGSVVVGHEVIHLRWSGDPTTTAPVQSFDRPNFTCG